MKDVLRLMRCWQWVKNVFVFFPLFFGHKLLNGQLLLSCVEAAGLFALLSSAVYCFNDICDCQTDRLHPVKHLRPLASGRVSKGQALLVMSVCLFLAFGGCWLFGLSDMMWIFVCYVVLNVTYSLWLKHVPIVDVVVLASFYVIRLVAGAMATGVENSHWIVLMTFLLALLLGLGKRRDDVVRSEEAGVSMRQSVSVYSLPFLHTTMGVVGAVTIVCYVMYTLSDAVMERVGSRYLFATSVFVLVAVIRYLQLAIGHGEGGSPTLLMLHDRFMQVCVLCWFFCYVLLLYLLP